MRRHRSLLVAAALLPALLGACSGDEEATDAAPTEQAAPTTASTTGTSLPGTSTTGAASGGSTGTSAPTSTTVAGPSQDDELPADQQGYTSALVRAWGVGDREAAARFATPTALSALFEVADPGGSDWEPLGCDFAGPQPACTFSSATADERLVLLYDPDLLGRPGAVVDLDVLPGA